MHRRTSTFILSAAVVAASIAAASAQPMAHRHHQHRQIVPAVYYGERPPLTVNKRSWLDPGPVAPVGSMSNYVTASTVFNRTPDQVNHRSLYGNELLPAPLEIPVRSQPLIEFETPGYPY